MSNLEKYYNSKGEVGVLISPEYGSGWSEQALNREMRDFLLMDKTLVKWALEGASEEEVYSYVENKFDDLVYGWGDVEVRWLAPGTKFRIHKYDGSESIIEYEKDNYSVA